MVIHPAPGRAFLPRNPSQNTELTIGVTFAVFRRVARIG